MANKAISELPQALNVNNQDLFVLEQSGIAKKLTAETFITEQGIIDALAEALDGHGGIQSVTLSSVSGRIRTYRITFTDQSATTFQVYDGTSIDRISRTSSSGLDDVYTIFLSDGTTTFFTVHNGADGTVSEAMLNDALKDKAPVITDTASGAIANFPDGADDIPVTSLVANIEPKQSGSGDPSPSNIRPISGWTGCNVTRAGKNLWNKDRADAQNGYYFLSGEFHADNSYRCLSFPCSPGDKFIKSGSGWGGIVTFWNNDSFVSGVNNTSVTIPSGANIVKFACQYNSADAQLELGSSATAYEAYQGATLTVDWTSEAGTVYGGTIDVTTGLLTVTHKTYTFTGSETFFKSGTANNGFYSYYLRDHIASADKIKVDSPVMCDTLIYTPSANTYFYNYGYVLADGAINLSIDPAIVGNTIESFTTWLSSHNIQIVYPLATPQTYQLTPRDVCTLLGTNNVWANTGDVSVTYPADTKIYLELTQLLQDNNLAYVESSSSASRTYAVNDLFVNRDGLLCKVTATVPSGGTLVEGTNYTILSGNGGLGAEVTSVLNGKEDVGWLTGMGFSRTDVGGGGNVTIKDYTIFLAKLITVSGANIQSLVNAHYKVTFYLRNSNGGSFSLSGNCAGNTYNLSSDSSGLVSGTYEGDVSANGTIYNGLVGGSVGNGSIFAATVLVKF